MRFEVPIRVRMTVYLPVSLHGIKALKNGIIIHLLLV
jgi:hypothetical protein